MPRKSDDSGTVHTWDEYVERYLPRDAVRWESPNHPVTLGEHVGRQVIEGAVNRLSEPTAEPQEGSLGVKDRA